MHTILDKIYVKKGSIKKIAQDLNVSEQLVSISLAGHTDSKKAMMIRDYAIKNLNGSIDCVGNKVYVVQYGPDVISICSSLERASVISESIGDGCKVVEYVLDKPVEIGDVSGNNNIYVIYTNNDKENPISYCFGKNSYKRVIEDISGIISIDGICTDVVKQGEINYKSLCKSIIEEGEKEPEQTDPIPETTNNKESIMIDDVDFGKGSIPIKLKNRLSELGCETLEQVASIPKEEIFEAEGLGRKAEYLLDKALEEYGLA